MNKSRAGAKESGLMCLFLPGAPMFLKLVESVTILCHNQVTYHYQSSLDFGKVYYYEKIIRLMCECHHSIKGQCIL